MCSILILLFNNIVEFAIRLHNMIRCSEIYLAFGGVGVRGLYQCHDVYNYVVVFGRQEIMVYEYMHNIP